MFLILMITQVLSCEKSVSFTECTSGHMSAILTPMNCSDSTVQIIPDLQCNTSCPVGQRLDYDESLHLVKCSICPEGTYSIGGGHEFSNWMNFLSDFHVYCWVLGTSGWELSTDCTTWHAFSDSVLVTGTSSLHTWYETDIVFFPLMVKDGYVEITYRKESASVQGYEVGDFYVFVDENLSYFDYSSDKLDWRVIKLPLSKGKHKVQIVYDKYVTSKISDAFIRMIVVKGSKYANKECEVCGAGHSPAGSDSCLSCEVGSYLDTTKKKCIQCPFSQSAPAGSIGAESCKNFPSCTDSDWHYYFSDCEGGRQKKVFEWNSPLLCTLYEQTLPEPINLECIQCGPGQFYDSNKCKHCATGTYSTLGAWGEDCKTCPAGKYAPKSSSFYSWTSFPEDFQGYCLTASKQYCSYDWETRGTYLTTSPIYTPGSQVVLQGEFEISEYNSTVEFLFSTIGKSVQFYFLVNEVQVFNVLGEQRQVFMTALRKGLNYLKWVCVHSSEVAESCQVLTVIINGTLMGGASTCMDCPAGFVSSGPSEACTLCPEGKSSNFNRTACVKCEPGWYSDSNRVCSKCPEGFEPSADGTWCQLLSANLTLEGHTFLLNNLSGAAGAAPLYCNQSKLQMFCYESFYGPVSGGHHYFYLSVFNPALADMPSYYQLSNDRAFAFAILSTKSIQVEGASNLKPDSECASNSSQVVANLGREIGSVVGSYLNGSTGFNVSYVNGDYCTGSQRFETFIRFVCSKEDEEGWPIFEGFEKCRFRFVWPTVHACHVCSGEEVVVHNESCSDGETTSHYFEGEQCIFEDRVSHKESKGLCDSARVYQSWPFVLSMVLSGVMVILVVVLVILAYQKRKGFKRLEQVRFGGNIEMSQSK